MRFRVSRLTSVLVFGFLLASSTSALATTRWVNDPPNTYSAPGTSCTSPGYPTIGAAVAAAVSGDTIMVCDGTYTENVTLNKSLTLLGAQKGVDACGRVASESIFSPLIPTNGTLELQTGSAGSIIDGFTFFGGTGLGSIRSTSGPIHGLQLLNNRIRGFTGNGVFLNDNGINITVDQNDIDCTVKTSSGACFQLDTDNFRGLRSTKNSAIDQNTFDRNNRNGLTLTSFGNMTADAGARSNTVTQNCFTMNGFSQAGAGIFFSATQPAGTISTNVAHQNNIFGNAMGA